MGKLLIGIIGFVYLIVAIDQWFKGNHGMAVAFLGYSIGNIGLVMLAT